MREIIAQDQMNIVRKVTEKYGIEQCDIRSEVEKELVVRGIVHNTDLIDDLAEDVEYRFQHKMDILEMDAQS